ncbi:MAG: DUF1559 domain-containing protein [Planctomycetes bacterium]|nr:DUF1559 domain-containing protein [Planctomycetota bacterium]
MREQLLGYLLGALDDSEHRQVEEHLQRDPQAQRELELLAGGLQPLKADAGHYDPPRGLAQRACEAVEARRTPVVLDTSFADSPKRWALVDVAVAAGIMLAVAAVFFPAVNHARAMARRAGCEDNLRQLGAALVSYSERHGGEFPSIEAETPLSVAGVYAPKLKSGGWIDNDRAFICPASPLVAERNTFRVPSIHELLHAGADQLAHWHRTMGGSYAFSLGYLDANNKYCPARNQRRANYALLADVPNLDGPSEEGPAHISASHGGCGQNVLFEDGHVKYILTCTCIADGCIDHIYLNALDQIAPGVNRNDAVLARSGTRVSIVAP